MMYNSSRIPALLTVTRNDLTHRILRKNPLSEPHPERGGVSLAYFVMLVSLCTRRCAGVLAFVVRAESFAVGDGRLSAERFAAGFWCALH